MTDQTNPPAAEIPDLGGFETYYGVRITNIGEDGDVIALGHVEPRRFIAAHIRYCREVLGYDLARESYSHRVAKEIERVWMAEDPDEAKANGTSWWLGMANEGQPGAFPVTFWSC